MQEVVRNSVLENNGIVSKRPIKMESNSFLTTIYLRPSAPTRLCAAFGGDDTVPRVLTLDTVINLTEGTVSSTQYKIQNTKSV